MRMPAPSGFSTMIHRARVAQLRAKAEQDGASIAETVERLISRCMEAGDLPDILPEYPVWAKDDGVVSAVLGEIVISAITPTSARKLSQVIRLMATAEEEVWTRSVALSDESVFAIRRRGKGLVFTRTPEPGANPAKTAMTMAVDLARQLGKAAGQATGRTNHSKLGKS
jgi:hypothetical protein